LAFDIEEEAAGDGEVQPRIGAGIHPGVWCGSCVWWPRCRSVCP
jgi:hypothetical protein